MRLNALKRPLETFLRLGRHVFYLSERKRLKRPSGGRGGIRLFISGLQNAGILDKYVSAAIETATSAGVRVCDCYSKWDRLNECGIDTTELLANKINHPDRNMNWLFAAALAETMFTD